MSRVACSLSLILLAAVSARRRPRRRAGAGRSGRVHGIGDRPLLARAGPAAQGEHAAGRRAARSRRRRLCTGPFSSGAADTTFTQQVGCLLQGLGDTLVTNVVTYHWNGGATSTITYPVTTVVHAANQLVVTSTGTVTAGYGRGVCRSGRGLRRPRPAQLPELRRHAADRHADGRDRLSAAPLLSASGRRRACGPRRPRAGSERGVQARRGRPPARRRRGGRRRRSRAAAAPRRPRPGGGGRRRRRRPRRSGCAPAGSGTSPDGQPPTITTRPPGDASCSAACHAPGRPTASKTSGAEAGGSAVGRGGAEGRCLRAALRVAVDDRHVAAVEHEQPREHQADRAAAQDHRDGLAAAAADRVHAGGQRLGHRRRGEGQAVGDRVQRGLGRRDPLREAAHHPRHRAAQVGRPGGATPTGTAGHRVADQDALAGVEPLARGLVAEARGVGAERRVAVLQHLQVGPAGRRRAHASPRPRPPARGRPRSAGRPGPYSIAARIRATPTP